MLVARDGSDNQTFQHVLNLVLIIKYNTVFCHPASDLNDCEYCSEIVLRITRAVFSFRLTLKSYFSILKQTEKISVIEI